MRSGAWDSRARFAAFEGNPIPTKQTAPFCNILAAEMVIISSAEYSVVMLPPQLRPRLPPSPKLRGTGYQASDGSFGSRVLSPGGPSRISAEIKSLRLTSESSGMDLVSTVLDGILLGGLYALFAAGLSLIFGVMRLVNIAHGDLIVLSAFVAMIIVGALGLHPLVTLVLVVPLMASLGYGLQRVVFNRALGHDILPPLLVSFGLSVFLQNALLQIFSGDSRRLHAGNMETWHFDLPGGIAVGVLPCVMFAVAVAVITGLQLLLYRTKLGRAFRSVSDDQETAQLMGINNAHLFGLAMALSLSIVSVAGVFLGIRANFDPSIGPTRLIFAFEAIIIGGLGDLWGTLVGGVILGVAQTLGARINPGYQILAGHIVFLAILTLRPQGFFPKTR